MTTERRHGYDPDHTGPERRQHDRRLKVLENSTKVLTAQSAEVAVILSGLDERLQRGVAAGLREVLADDDLMDDLLERLRGRLARGAAEHTGRWLLGTLRAFLSKWVVIGVIVVLVAQYAGWAPAKIVAGWLTGGSK